MFSVKTNDLFSQFNNFIKNLNTEPKSVDM